MIVNPYFYQTKGEVKVTRFISEISANSAIEGILSSLDSQRGGLLASSYEYPGRYKRWAIGFVNPPIELSTRENSFTFTALNERGLVLLPHIAEYLSEHSQLQGVSLQNNCCTGTVKETERSFSEEERSKQPSVFTVIRAVLQIFSSSEDSRLGFYGAMGYDLVFQFESITKHLERPDEQRDLVLYIPDELTVVDRYSHRAYCYQYEFETKWGKTNGLLRTGEKIDYRGQKNTPQRASDHEPDEYANLVREALHYFQRGDLFEVVPSQNFFAACEESPTKLFRLLQQINPSPYGFIFNLGGEYLIGASPEMYVRVEGKRVETCPISGTISRGKNAIDDADRILELLNSRKDEAELTMCTDVDRNDKSRICEPGSVNVIGRRQVEMYSHLIHTVDHVEGLLRSEFDALDAFLSHTWAVTVTGAPKRAAIGFIEQNENSARRWYGGAVGYLTFDGNMNTGLILRTIRLQDSIAEVRVGATLLYDSDPEAEAQETLTKAAALFQTLYVAKEPESDKESETSIAKLAGGKKNLKENSSKRVLLIDYEDSFVHTLANYIRQTGVAVKTLRHGFDESVFDREKPDMVILSPGPGRPSDFKIAETIAACRARKIPLFGVCLGLQGIVEACGGELGVLHYPQHGKMSRISVTDTESILFKGLPSSFTIGRYHSLFAMRDRLPAEFKVTAFSEDEVIMAIEHRTEPIAAVQFHPESIMSLGDRVGLTIIENIIATFTQTEVAPVSYTGVI